MDDLGSIIDKKLQTCVDICMYVICCMEKKIGFFFFGGRIDLIMSHHSRADAGLASVGFSVTYTCSLCISCCIL